MISVSPVTLEGHGVRLEPLTLAHEEGLRAAAEDGRLSELWYTSVPAPDAVAQYITTANEGMAAGHMLPWAVLDVASGAVAGSTRYHDIVPAVDRVEIGYTFYAQRFQRTHVNSACKLLLLTHAFETVGCEVVGLRTDNFNFRSQRAIEGIGAKRDGIIRHHAPRRDGTARDTYIYSILVGEWPDVKRHLETRLARNGAAR
jgi:RimJ/RimL family protein N-acetyltransferase